MADLWLSLNSSSISTANNLVKILLLRVLVGKLENVYYDFNEIIANGNFLFLFSD